MINRTRPEELVQMNQGNAQNAFQQAKKDPMALNSQNQGRGLMNRSMPQKPGPSSFQGGGGAPMRPGQGRPRPPMPGGPPGRGGPPGGRAPSKEMMQKMQQGKGRGQGQGQGKRFVDDDRVSKYDGPIDKPPGYENQQESPEPEQMEAIRQKTLLDKKKGFNASRHYIIDPKSGFAIDRRKLQAAYKREQDLEIAKVLPASDRAVFLWRKGIIDKEDIPEPSAKEQLEMMGSKIRLLAGIQQLENAQRDAKNYISPRDQQIHQDIRSMISKGNYEGAMLLSKQLENPLDFDVKALVDADQKNLINAAKNDNFGDQFEERYGIKYSKFRDSHGKWLKDSITMFEQNINKPELLQDNLRQLGVPDYETAMKMFEDGQWDQWEANYKATNPVASAALRKLPQENVSESDYINFIKEAYILQNMRGQYGNRTFEMYRAHEEWIASKQADILKNATDPSANGDPEVTQRYDTTQPPPVVQPESKPQPEPAPKPVPKPVPKPKVSSKVEKPEAQGDTIQVSGSATNILKQAKKAGYNKSKNINDFIRELNEATGGNFTANNLPAEMPVFWKKEDKKVGKRDYKKDPYTLSDLGGEVGSTLKEKIVDPVTNTAKEVYNEGPVRAGLMNLGTLSQLPLFPDSGDKAIEHGEKGSGQNPNPSIMGLIFGKDKKK